MTTTVRRNGRESNVVHINLMKNKEHFGKFCRAMDKVMGCRHRHCEKSCWAWAVRDIQSWCDEGVTIDAAANKWAESGLTHKDGEDIWCDILDVSDLDVVRELLKEGGDVEEKQESVRFVR